MMPDAATSFAGFALPVLAGVSFSTIGIAYQAAQKRGVLPPRVLMLLAICGSVFFVVRWLPDREMSWRMGVLGLACGVGQFVSIRMVARAMALGPFSLIWCMLSLNFVPVVLYAATVQGRDLPWTQWAAVGTSMLCCILAAISMTGTSAARTGSRIRYGVLLAMILLINAMPNVAIQDLATSGQGQSTTGFFLAMYVAIAVSCIADAVVAGEMGQTIGRGWAAGLFAGAGSISGMLCLAMAAARSGPAAFLICSMVTLILPMVAAVAVFHERVSLRWLATLVLALAAIGLANL